MRRAQARIAHALSVFNKARLELKAVADTCFKQAATCNVKIAALDQQQALLREDARRATKLAENLKKLTEV